MLNSIRSQPLNLDSLSRIIVRRPAQELPSESTIRGEDLRQAQTRKEKEEEREDSEEKIIQQTENAWRTIEWRSGVPVIYGGVLGSPSDLERPLITPQANQPIESIPSSPDQEIKTSSTSDQEIKTSSTSDQEIKTSATSDQEIKASSEVVNIVSVLERVNVIKTFSTQSREGSPLSSSSSSQQQQQQQQQPPTLSPVRKIGVVIPETENASNLLKATLKDLDPINSPSSPSSSPSSSIPQTLNSDTLSPSFISSRKSDPPSSSSL